MITPERMIDELNGVFGSHPGCRALHAKGTLCKGHFTATPEAKRLTRAPHMQGERHPAIVRLSNGGGDPRVPDGARDVRGLTAKIDLPGGERTDLSFQTVPRAPTRTPDEFIELVKASEIKPVNAIRMPLYLVRHPKTLTALPGVNDGTTAPVSYACAHYYAMHAFKWLDADGGHRFVRYEMVPEAPAAKAGREDRAGGRDFLQNELRERLAAGPIRFTYVVQIAGPGDDPDDPTSIWSKDGERVTVGTLEITGLETQRETNGDVVVFDPARVPDGIELTDDPILRFRSQAYSESVKRRTGIERPADYPY